MLADKARPEANLLSAFALAIVGALASWPAYGPGHYLGMFLKSTDDDCFLSKPLRKVAN
jgi:hypothetical protein